MELNLAQLDEGHKTALSNASDLVDEARILLRNHRWARALFLSQLAAEELGKYAIIISTTINLTRAKQLGYGINWTKFWKDFWTRYRSHREKASLLIHLEHFFSDSRPHKYLRKIPQESLLAEEVKMASLYSDFYEKFQSPRDLIDEQVSSLAVRLAEKRVRRLKSYDREIIGQEGFPKLSKKDFELWDEKMGITWKHLITSVFKSYSN